VRDASLPDPTFWRGKRVFVTGHTGFKGSWLTLWLAELGAELCGYALPPDTAPSLFEAAGIGGACRHVEGDVRDLEHLSRTVREFTPEIAFHLAAQPLVRRSYRAPVETFATNVQGTVHFLEACRVAPGLAAAVVVTTDKVYADHCTARAYSEDDALGGHDPYAASKACAEMVSSSYRDSFLARGGIAVATARAGNVIGGGDWSEDRLIPDAARAFAAGRPLRLRKPDAIRPWQHVVEPLSGYLMLAERLAAGGASFAEAWNFGPSPEQMLTVAALADAFADAWGPGAVWVAAPEPGAPHETERLVLGSDKAQARLGWRPRLSPTDSIAATAEWYRAHARGAGAVELRRLMLACCEVLPIPQTDMFRQRA
jgi:CDP-glucose 4,6-dehydratase